MIAPECRTTMSLASADLLGELSDYQITAEDVEKVRRERKEHRCLGGWIRRSLTGRAPRCGEGPEGG
jgi:hypothetical protein